MGRILNKIGYASPIVIVSGLYVTYMAAPEFYLSYILEEAHREQGAVEIVTFLSALIRAHVVLFNLAAVARRELVGANPPRVGNPLMVERKFWWVD